MAEVKKTAPRKAPATKATTTGAKVAQAATKKPASKRGIDKGQTLACEVCGLAVTVDQIGDVAVEEDTVLLCCGKPMKANAAAKKTAKK